MNEKNTVLVTGATGYIGGRLVPRLLERGYPVRVLARDRARVSGCSWSSRVEVVRGDPLRPETLEPALGGVATAFYFIHSMTSGPDFRRRDITAARNFARAARQAGVGRIVYLGGLGDPEADLSEHLRSRHETGAALREAGVPVTEFRAAVVVGAGSISFEMVRNLTERLPVMICPRWVYTRAQPIAVDDVLAYLTAALATPASAGETVEIGGADILTYGQMMTGYARVRALRRFLIPVPVLTPRLSSYWVHWVTPVGAAYARPLIEGLRNEVVVRNDKAATLFPDIRPANYETAVRQALAELKAERFAPRVAQLFPVEKSAGKTRHSKLLEGMIVERRRRPVQAPAAKVYDVFASLGGRKGWLCYNWAWRLRAWVDHLIGGVGLRRTRPERGPLRKGDVVDFYRVEAVEPERLLRLYVEMKLPGRGWVQFQAEPRGDNRCDLTQTVFFAPKGLFGLLYWYAFCPAHRVIFCCLLRRIAKEAGTSCGEKG
ncbi:MAG: SDR family oxidoreductase [Sedimentisphaerales bacterium]|nr:SDR family oxidoreductase [Sedimentisphaerales bacterium]